MPRDTLARVLSLSGVLGLGGFLVVHAGLNATALWGTSTFARVADALHGVPGIGVLEALLVFAPLAVHGAAGLWAVATRPELPTGRLYPKPVALFVRVTGAFALVFVVAHLREIRFRAGAPHLGGEALATALASDLSTTRFGVPWRGVGYLVGIGCVVFHFAAGLWAYLGVRIGAGRDGDGAERQARGRWLAWGCGVLGGALWLALAATVVFHATGARPFRSVDLDVPASGPCPEPLAPAR